MFVIRLSRHVGKTLFFCLILSAFLASSAFADQEKDKIKTLKFKPNPAAHEKFKDEDLIVEDKDKHGCSEVEKDKKTGVYRITKEARCYKHLQQGEFGCTGGYVCNVENLANCDATNINAVCTTINKGTANCNCACQ